MFVLTANPDATTAGELVVSQRDGCPTLTTCLCSTTATGIAINCVSFFYGSDSSDITGLLSQISTTLSVETFDFSRNNFPTIPSGLTAYTGVKNLILSDNSITSIDTTLLPSSLVSLVLSNNQVTSLDVGSISSFTALCQLDLSLNQLTFIIGGTIRCPDSTKAAYLNLASNAITTIQLPQLNMIGGGEFKLTLTGNSLTSLDGNLLTMSQTENAYVYFDQNAITQITNPLTISATSTVKFNCNNNQITSIPSASFSFTAASVELYLNHNLISSCTLLTSITKLYFLDLSYNSLTSVDSSWFSFNPASTMIINLSHNSIATITNPPLTLSTDEIEINLSYNAFTSFSPDWFTFTTIAGLKMYFNNNQIASFTTGAFQLTVALALYLDFSYNSLSAIPSTLVTSLSTVDPSTLNLDFSYNKGITSIKAGDLTFSKKVSFLGLKGNSISSIAIDSLPSKWSTIPLL